MADDKLTRLLRVSGSLDEKTQLAKELDDETLQKAVPRSVEAKVEWERRLSAKRDAREEETLSIARQANTLAKIAIICSVIAAIVAAFIA